MRRVCEGACVDRPLVALFLLGRFFPVINSGFIFVWIDAWTDAERLGKKMFRLGSDLLT